MMDDEIKHSRYGEGFGFTHNVAIDLMLSRMSDEEQKEYLEELKSRDSDKFEEFLAWKKRMDKFD